MLSRIVKVQVKVAALRSDRGATAVEYGLMVSLIAVVIIVSVTAFGQALRVTLFGMITSSLPF